MKFFLDENLPLSASDAVRALGYEVEHARHTALRGAPDKKIADYARERKAILVTRDLEFGSLLLYPPDSHHGLLVVRLPHYFTAQQIVTALRDFLTKIPPESLVNAVTVLEAGRYRKRSVQT